MPTRTLIGRIIALAPRAEKFVHWELLCAAEGFVGITVPLKLSSPYSLFDKVEVMASAKGKGLFLQEAHLLDRPRTLAQNYAALCEASRLANLLRQTFNHTPDYQPVATVFDRSLEIYPLSPAPMIVTLKALYKILDAEGFPVGQDWLNGLPAGMKTRADELLKSQPNEAQTDTQEPILLSLIAWMGQELGVKTNL